MAAKQSYDHWWHRTLWWQLYQVMRGFLRAARDDLRKKPADTNDEG